VLLVLTAPLGSGVVPVTAPGAGAGVAPPRGPSKAAAGLMDVLLAAWAARSLATMVANSVSVSMESAERPGGRCLDILGLELLFLEDLGEFGLEVGDLVVLR